MADYWEQFSEVMVVPPEKKDAVNAFLDEYERQLDAGELDDLGGGVDVMWDEDNLWFHADENFDPAALTYLAQGCLKAIDDPEDRPFVVSIAYTCSRPIIGEFGGRAVAFWKNDEYWLEARSAVDEYIKFHDGRPE